MPAEREPPTMVSTTSLKELIKAINAFLADPTVPLPETLVGILTSFTQQQEKYDDSAADQLQDSLLSTFDKRVKGNARAVGPWIAILRQLLPVLQTPERILPWFDACRGILDRSDLDKCVVDETVASFMDLITVIDEFQVSFAANSAASRIIDRLFQVWMRRFYPALLEGDTSSEYNERLIRHALCNFGKKRPKEFFTAMDGYFVQSKHRKAALRLLCDFIQIQPPHLHQVLHTSLFGNLMTCLQHDKSTTIVSAALTTLIMLLPHMPSSLVPHLPALFNIYGRLLFWDREHSRTAEWPDSDGTSPEPSLGWEVAAFDTDVDDASIAHLPNYYTILYGLYPINFMDYIRKPQRYMRHANAANADEVEVQPTEMRHRSETFRRNHLLHPNFYSLTIDSEKADFGRWIKSEAAEVVAECMGLCLETDLYSFADVSSADMPSSGPAGANALDNAVLEKSKADAALLSGPGGKRDSWRNSRLTTSDSLSSNQTPITAMRRSSQSSMPSHRDSTGDSRSRTCGTDSPTLTLSPSHPQLQDLIQSNKAIKSGLHQSLANDSVASLALSHQDSVAEKAAPGASAPAAPLPPTSHSPFSASEMSTQVTHLQKQILLLQNDLSFERYLKQQHMAHIGDLRRKQMAEAATEAETQNLILMNRNLKSRFEEAKKSEMQVKKESEKSRAMAKKWEADLANRLKDSRHKSNKKQAEMEALQRELEESKQEADKLQKLLCAAEVKELNWKQNVQSIELHGAEIDRLKAEVERLTRSERDHQARELERQQMINSATKSESRAEALRMRLEAQEYEVQRVKKLFQTQVAALQSQLSEAREERERPGSNSNIAVESALAASRAKQAELQKQHSLLMRKYTALQSSLLDMQAEQPPEQPRPTALKHQPTDADYVSLSTSPVVVKARPQRSLSNAEATGHNMRSSEGLQPGGTTSGATPAKAGSGSQPEESATPISPDQRSFGKSPTQGTGE
ncbi:hamartin [Metarhizium album ARSEF 1941]|uniref:Hamartin n=1 Tax=Metarhizium album (strain ARSEF 1941) TaxID=1081103 RepID=A0A0B2WYM3_METAS|nr:hamartin [Metarhizium album ARSEF 1941]KHN97950.1 hamartin [Metarhizium album ARSEF 1941]